MNVISEKEVGQSGKVKGDSTKGPDAAPSTQKGDVPSTQKGDVPSTQKGDVPSTQKGDVPSTQKGDAVGGKLKEVKFATTPIMSTYVSFDPYFLFCPNGQVNRTHRTPTNAPIPLPLLVGRLYCWQV